MPLMSFDSEEGFHTEKEVRQMDRLLWMVSQGEAVFINKCIAQVCVCVNTLGDGVKLEHF